MALDILIVDDERDIRELVAGVLEDEGYAPRTAADSDAALAAIAERRPSLVLLDVWLQGSRLDGLDLLDVIKARDPSRSRDFVARQSRHGRGRDPAGCRRFHRKAVRGGTVAPDGRPRDRNRPASPRKRGFEGAQRRR
jgi:CheY-like chemotaxis protein